MLAWARARGLEAVTTSIPEAAFEQWEADQPGWPPEAYDNDASDDEE
jgi:hypothetical protein